MKSIVQNALKQGAESNAYKLRFLKLIYLRDNLENHKILLENYDKIFNIISKKKPNELIKSNTTFFWKNLQRFYHSSINEKKKVDSTGDFLFRSFFDSFFNNIPNNFEIILSGKFSGKFVFPNLGIKYISNSERLTLKKESNHIISMRDDMKEDKIDIKKIGHQNRLFKTQITKHGFCELIFAKDISLFEEEYSERISTETSNDIFLSKLISKSLELIEVAMPHLYSQMISFIRYYIPMDAPNQLTHNSMSVKYLSGVIFISSAYNDFRLAEALVHEYHHNELYLLQETESLFKHNDELYYSPFREDPRPLNGLFHAVYVFSGVAEFIKNIEDNVIKLSDFKDSLIHRRKEVIRQVRFGLLQIPYNELTILGKEIYDEANSIANLYEIEFGTLTKDNMPSKLKSHMEEWISTNPDLKKVLVIPE
jgi:hypothetical protein